MQYLSEIFDAVTTLPVDSVLGGVFLALVLASPVGLAYNVGRRRGKDASMMLVGLATAMNFIGMALAIGHAQYVNDSAAVKPRQTSSYQGVLPLAQPQPGSPNRGTPPTNRPRLSDIIAERITPDILSEGDMDHDGRLSTDEAADVVTAFIKSSASGKDASCGQEEIRRVIAERIEPYLRSLFQNPSALGRDVRRPTEAAIPPR